MKFLVPSPVYKGPDLSDILDRIDLSVDEKIDMVFEKHGPVAVSFDCDWSHFKKRWERFEAEYAFSDDEDDIDDEDNDAEEIGKMSGDEKEPGIVRRPPQAPLEGELVCKLPRTTPQGEESPQFGEARYPESAPVR